MSITKTTEIIKRKAGDLGFSSCGISKARFLKEENHVLISIEKNIGLENLKNMLVKSLGVRKITEGQFAARQRHIEALTSALKSIADGFEQLKEHKAGELLAEDLSQAQQELGTITGAFSSDDLLGEIFSSFCIGK